MVDKKQEDNKEQDSLKSLLNNLMGKKLSENRKRLGLTQEELSELLSLNSNKDKTRTLQRWEAGHTPVPAWVMAQVDMLDAQVKHLDERKEKRAFIMENAVLAQPKTADDFLIKVRNWLNKLI